MSFIPNGMVGLSYALFNSIFSLSSLSILFSSFHGWHHYLQMTVTISRERERERDSLPPLCLISLHPFPSSYSIPLSVSMEYLDVSSSSSTLLYPPLSSVLSSSHHSSHHFDSSSLLTPLPSSSTSVHPSDPHSHSPSDSERRALANKKRGIFPKAATNAMRNWLFKHLTVRYSVSNNSSDSISLTLWLTVNCASVKCILHTNECSLFLS